MTAVTTRARIDVDRERLIAFCREHQVEKMSLFGSVLRPEFAADSDVDMLVEFARGRTPSLTQMVGLEAELGDILGRKVDLRTPAGLSQYIRHRVLADAETLYVRR